MQISTMTQVPPPSEILAKYREVEDYIHNYCFEQLCNEIRSKLTFTPSLSTERLNEHFESSDKACFVDVKERTFDLTEEPKRHKGNLDEYTMYFKPHVLKSMFADKGYDMRQMVFKNGIITCTLRELAPPTYQSRKKKKSSILSRLKMLKSKYFSNQA
jgi:hypothetical protein